MAIGGHHAGLIMRGAKKTFLADIFFVLVQIVWNHRVVQQNITIVSPSAALVLY